MFLEFIGAIFAFLFARAIWDFTKRRAEVMEMSPLHWLTKVSFYIALLCVFGYAFLLALVYAVTHS